MSPVTMAVFRDCSGTQLSVIGVHLEADTGGQAAADAAARGFKFAGTIAVIDGEPQVSMEPHDPLAPAALLLAGPLFAAVLGPVIQEHQRGDMSRIEGHP